MMLTIKPVSVDNKKWIDLSNDLKEFQTGNGKMHSLLMEKIQYILLTTKLKVAGIQTMKALLYLPLIRKISTGKENTNL